MRRGRRAGRSSGDGIASVVPQKFVAFIEDWLAFPEASQKQVLRLR
jgi:hypothetical protein